MCAIDCEYLEMFALGVSHPTGDICRFTIQRMRDRVTVSRQTCLARGELIASESQPNLARDIAKDPYNFDFLTLRGRRP